MLSSNLYFRTYCIVFLLHWTLQTKESGDFRELLIICKCSSVLWLSVIFWVCFLLSDMGYRYFLTWHVSRVPCHKIYWVGNKSNSPQGQPFKIILYQYDLCNSVNHKTSWSMLLFVFPLDVTQAAGQNHISTTYANIYLILLQQTDLNQKSISHFPACSFQTDVHWYLEFIASSISYN